MYPPILLKSLVFLLFCVSVTAFAAAQDITGKVQDATTGEPLVGATISLEKSGHTIKNVYSGLDGSFVFRRVPEGSYVVTVHFVGYELYSSANVQLTKNNTPVVLNMSLQPQRSSLQNVQVQSLKSRESDEFARKTEKLADNVMNIVSAKTIELSPDLTVGNVLQRVSGVSVERTSTGDGQYAIIRGMDKRYNYTLINGINVPSPDDKNRAVPLDMFPSDMIERLELIKALTPRMEANAIGGGINLVMKDAPAHFTLGANIAVGMGQLFMNRSFSGFSHSGISFFAPWEMHGTSYIAKPADFTVSQLNFHKVNLPLNTVGSISLGDRLFHKKLGYLVAASYSRQYRGSNTLFYEANAQPRPDPAPNTPTFVYVHNRQYSDLQSRLGLHARLDYEIAPGHKINLYGLMLQLDDNNHRFEEVTGLGGVGEIDHNDRVQFNRKNLYNATLSGSDAIAPKLSADWALSYALATSKTPDWVDLSTFKGVNDTTFYLSSLPHIWTRTREQDKSAYLNFTYKPVTILEFTAGGMYRYKDRSNLYTEYTLSPLDTNRTRQPFTTIDKAQFFFATPGAASADTTEGLSYSADETVAAAYIQGKLTLNKWQILAGVRTESTSQHYYSQLASYNPGKTGSISYQDVLPSVHLKYGLTSNQNLRLSYYASISRPSLYDLVPGQSNGDIYNEVGNYNLKHAQADNLDLRYENFMSPTEQLMAGVFYKHITNPIEYAFVAKSSGSVVYEPTNPQGSANNYGFELVFSKFIRNWGIGGNYSYTHSSITTTKDVYGRDASGAITNTLANETRPLQGQSDHVANISLLYRSAANGLDAQLSLVYTGKRIAVVSPYLGLDYWQQPTYQLDFSAEKKIRHHFAVFVKATNLLNNSISQVVYHQNSLKGLQGQTMNDKITVQKEVFNQTYFAGVRYKL